MSVSEVSERIIRYEDEGMSPLETVRLYQDLINSGLAFSLQGFYQRVCLRAIENGFITHADERDPDFEDPEYLRKLEDH